MDVYKLLKLNRSIRSNRLKLLLIFIAHILNRRYYSVRIDPILGCNLRCLMCYFSRDRKPLPEKFSAIDFEMLAKNLFRNALQVVVGCGAEPTIHPGYINLIKLAGLYKVPHVALVTNGQLITLADLQALADTGLHELTLSVHGTEKHSYEYFMVGAKWDKLHTLLQNIKQLKAERKIAFTLRINYTANPDNINELENFFTVFGEYPINILQVRPIMDIGGAYFSPFTSDNISNYYQALDTLRSECNKRDVTLLANTQNPDYKLKTPNPIVKQTYKYVSPQIVIDKNFEWQTETYRHYLRRTGWHWSLLKAIVGKQKSGSTTDMAEQYSGQYDIW